MRAFTTTALLRRTPGSDLSFHSTSVRCARDQFWTTGNPSSYRAGPSNLRLRGGSPVGENHPHHSELYRAEAPGSASGVVPSDRAGRFDRDAGEKMAASLGLSQV